MGLRVAAASTHPFSRWEKQDVTTSERSLKLEEDMGELARRLLIFGMHVHIGIEDKELMIDVMNQVRYFLPHILALSTSSPFWDGREYAAQILSIRHLRKSAPLRSAAVL